MKSDSMEALEGFHSLSLEEKLDDAESPKTASPVSSASEETEEHDDEEEEGECDEEERVSGTEEGADSETNLGKNGQPKKRVQFPDDDLLVSILEIPARGDSPLTQELEPCDPNTLVVDLGDVHLDRILSKRASRRKPVMRRPQNRVPRKKTPVVKPPPPPPQPKISPAVQRLYGAPLPRTSNSESCRKRLTPRSPKPQLRSSSCVNAPNHSNRAQAYTVNRTENRSSRIDLDTSHLRSSSAHSFRSSTSTSLPSTRVHLSPYRQSSASSMSPNHFSSLRNLSSLRPSSSSVPSASASGASAGESTVNTVSKDGSVSVIRQFSSADATTRDQSFTSSVFRDSKGYSQDLYSDNERVQGFRGFRAVPVSAKKVFAWNMANSQFPHIEEPSISPMWDSVQSPRQSYSIDANGYF